MTQDALGMSYPQKIPLSCNGGERSWKDAPPHPQHITSLSNNHRLFCPQTDAQTCQINARVVFTCLSINSG